MQEGLERSIQRQRLSKFFLYMSQNVLKRINTDLMIYYYIQWFVEFNRVFNDSRNSFILVIKKRQEKLFAKNENLNILAPTCYECRWSFREN